MRISELLALTWQDVDVAAGVVHVRAQLSRAHRGVPPRRVAPKTAAYVVATGHGPLGHRNVEGRALDRAATAPAEVHAHRTRLLPGPSE